MTNNKKLPISLLLLLTIFFFTLSVPAQDNQFEKIKAVKTIKGKFIRFVVGDYIHPEIRKSNGKIRYFFMDSYDLQYFMVVNRGKTMTFIYEVIETFYGNDEQKLIERIKSARIGNLTFEKWWKALRKKYTIQQIKKKYNPLVEKYTKN